MANAKETSPAKHKYRVIMSESRTWDIDVEAPSPDEAIEKADMLPPDAWNIGDSDFETVEVQQLTKDCLCGAVMEYDDFKRRWGCEECHTVES
jgi:hypothetical protein